MNINEISLQLNTGGTSAKLAISSTSAPMATAATTTAATATNPGDSKGAAIPYVITPDTACFVRKGTGTPVAVSDGTDQYLAANQSYRVELMDGEKMAFITTSASGNVYITPRG